jgi:hypothetical protein
VFANTWRDLAIHDEKPRFTVYDGAYDPDLVIKKWREAYRRFYLYRPKRVWEKVSNKRFWLELPTTLATAKRFFIGDKVQKPPAASSDAKRSPQPAS